MKHTKLLAAMLSLLLLSIPIINGFSPSTTWALLHYNAALEYDAKGPISPSVFSAADAAV